MVQTAITPFMDTLANGTLQGTGPHELASKVSESATDIFIGAGLIRGTDKANQVLLPSALYVGTETSDFAGWVVNPNYQEKLLASAAGEVVYGLEDQLATLIDGMGAIRCKTAFTAGQPCYHQVILNAGIPAGSLSGTLDAINAEPLSWRFENSGIADDIAIINKV